MIINRYLLVSGEFVLRYKCKTRIVGSQPDGDSVRFKPANPKLLDLVPKTSGKAKFNTAGNVQLRFEAIDALETHFDFKLKTHQHPGLGNAARDFTLKTLGFTNVEYSGKNELTVSKVDQESVPGYLMVGQIDSNGRPVAFVFAGKPFAKPGSWHEPDVKWLKNSVNCQLAQAGLAYPAYYTTLPYVLRAYFDKLFAKAKKPPKQLWKSGNDKSETGVPGNDLAKLQALACWPKMFRRIVGYMSKTNNAPISEFHSWLKKTTTVNGKKKPNDDVAWVIGQTRQVHLRDVFEVKGATVRMRIKPESLLVVPK